MRTIKMNLKMRAVDLGVLFLGLFLAMNALAVESGSLCPANRGTDLVFPKKAELRIVAYDVKTKTYTINSFKFPGEGDSYITLDALAAAVPKVRQRLLEIRQKPDDIIDEVYTPVLDIPTLMPKEREARQGCREK